MFFSYGYTRISEKNKLCLLIWLQVSCFYQKSKRLSNEYLQKFGISIAQFDTLAQIYIHQPISQQGLAEYLTVSRGSVSQMLKRLEKENLITRQQIWKVKYISLTEKGQELVKKVLPLQSDFQASFFDILDDNEKKKLHEMMMKIHKYSMQGAIPSPLE